MLKKLILFNGNFIQNKTVFPSARISYIKTMILSILLYFQTDSMPGIKIPERDSANLLAAESNMN